METVHQLYRKVAEAAGATAAFADSTHTLISKWLVAVGGTPKFLDNKHDLLRKVTIALGKTPKPSDTFNDFLQKISGLPPGNSEWDCLRSLVPDTDVSFPGGFVLTGPLNVVDAGSGSFTYDLSWTASPGVDHYVIQFSVDDTFADPLDGVISVFPVDALSYNGIGADYVNQPRWIRVVAFDAAELNPVFSSVIVLNVATP